MRRVLTRIEDQASPVVLAACVAAVVMIGAADIVSGADYALTVAYIIPISLITWRAGRHRGALLSALAFGSLVLAEVVDPLSDVSTPAFLWNQLARLGVFIFIVLLISSLRDARQYAELMARTDVLTGLANLFAFREASAIEFERSWRSGDPLTLLFLDIDDFKVVNDYHGHLTGDEMLRRIARALASAARASDLVARVGGDEFVILMRGANADQATQVIARVRNRLAAINRPDGSPITCSIGVATHGVVPASIDDLLQEADRSMYAAKAAFIRDQRSQSDRALRLLTPAADAAPDANVVGMDT